MYSIRSPKSASKLLFALDASFSLPRILGIFVTPSWCSTWTGFLLDSRSKASFTLLRRPSLSPPRFPLPTARTFAKVSSSLSSPGLAAAKVSVNKAKRSLRRFHKF